MAVPLLKTVDLRVQFNTDDGLVRAVDGVSFELKPGETLGIVGESGSGKTVTNLAILGLTPKPASRVSGEIWYRGQELLSLSPKEMRSIRGHRIAMIFQDPLTALNPFRTIEEQLTEVTRLHLGHSARQARSHAIAMLERVGIPSAARRIDDYPHQFSGGMRQRVMIAMALSCRPDVLIADEPTTALDVTIQAQILDLMRELQQSEGTSIILITHDLGVVAKACHRVLVMYAGRVVESAPVDDLFRDPQHPYTRGLLASIPRWDERGSQLLKAIDGQPPDLAHLPTGCAFHPRCSFKVDRCVSDTPRLESISDQRQRACYVELDARPAPEIPG